MSYFWGLGGCCCPDPQYFTVRKFTSGGSLIWQRDYGHGATIYCVTVDAEDNVYVGGQWDENHYTVHKYDPSGDLLCPIATGFTPRGIAVDEDGHLYVTGLRESDVTTRKIMSDGTPGFEIDWGKDTYCLALKGDYFYIGGKRVPGDAVDGSTYHQLAKYDLDGNVIWRVNNGSDYLDLAPNLERSYVSCLTIDDDENVYICGNGRKAEAIEISISGTATGGSFGLSFLGHTLTIPWNATASQIATAIETQLPSILDGGPGLLDGINAPEARGGPLPTNPCRIYVTLGDSVFDSGHPFPSTKRFPTNTSVVSNSLTGGGTASVVYLDKGKTLGGENLLGPTGVTKLDSDGNLIMAWPSTAHSLAVNSSGTLYVGYGGGFRKLGGTAPFGTLVYTSPTSAFPFGVNGIAVDSIGNISIAGAGAGGSALRQWSYSTPSVRRWDSRWSNLFIPDLVNVPFASGANALTVDSQDNLIAVGIRVRAW